MSRSQSQSQNELIRLLREQMSQQQQQMEALLALVQQSKPAITNTKFGEFDPSIELWADYWARFETFTKANAIPDERRAEIFLTNQTNSIYKLVKNLAQQQTPPRDVNNLTMAEIETYMADQFNPKRFVVRERFKFWTNTERKPGETVHELAARIRQEAATCDFASISDPLDEAMRTRFVCSIHNESTIKALFKIKNDELTFTRAIEIAAEAEEATRVAKETLGTREVEMHKLFKRKPATKPFVHKPQQPQQNQQNWQQQQHRKGSHQRPTQRRCSRCDGAHTPESCRFATAICRFCNIKGHIEAACRKKKHQKVKIVKTVRGSAAKPLTQQCFLSGHPVRLEVDTGSRDNFISLSTWHQIGRPKMSPTSNQYRPLASGSSPSELLNGRQIRTKLDVIVPAQRLTPATVRREPAPARRLTNDSPCFALSYKAGRRDTWRPAVVTAYLGHQLFEVRVLPDGPTWRRHVDQLRPRHARHQHGHIVNSDKS
ncbi:hypothetical protein EGW08_005574 [Elysia chlorotica]|uniref:Peptidase A2 domain-containing protein n=1 Tax=Elysia chlorotica TaxID=188477 RepID=A0A3S1AAE1_ELYCH|nr:hypothetical protein EGW08_005574 [Elysia chlorotica]